MKIESVNKSLGVVNFFSFIFILVSAAAFLFLFLFYEEAEFSFERACKKLQEKEHRLSLSLFPPEKTTILPDFSRIISFVGRNTRPDRKAYHPLVALSVQGERLALRQNEKAFLKREATGWKVTREETPLSITPLEGNAVEVHLAFGEITHREICELCTAEKKPLVEEGTLAKAAVLGPNRLFSLYGGSVYGTLGDALRLKQEGAPFAYIKEQSLLIWDGLRWRTPQKEEDTIHFSIARLSGVEDGACSFSVWDVSGFTQREVVIPYLRAHGMRSGIEIVDVRQRTKHRVSCRIDGKSKLISQGDWLLKVGEEWHRVDTSEEVRRILSHELEGDLFIFDGIEERGKELICKGTLFDASRSQEKKMAFPVKRLRHREKDRPIAKRIVSRK